MNSYWCFICQYNFQHMTQLDALYFKFVFPSGMRSAFTEAEKHREPRGASASPLIKSGVHWTCSRDNRAESLFNMTETLEGVGTIYGSFFAMFLLCGKLTAWAHAIFKYLIWYFFLEFHCYRSLINVNFWTCSTECCCRWLLVKKGSLFDVMYRVVCEKCGKSNIY